MMIASGRDVRRFMTSAEYSIAGIVRGLVEPGRVRRGEGSAMIRVTWMLAASLSLMLTTACSSAHAPRETAPAAPSAPAAPLKSPAEPSTIDHLLPRRDSSGPMPSRFEWTPVPGADNYVMGIWNEVDVLVWRADNLHSPSVDWPKGIALEPGTYFWAVTATRDDVPVGDSGRAAFIVIR